jgi:hypothetical protein
MPEPSEYRADPTLPTDKAKPRYLQVLVGAFILPLFLLWKKLFKGADGRAVALGFGMVTLIGWAWSMTLSYNHWWIFPRKWLIGIKLLPNLPLEEMLFYPMVMLFMIGFYNFFDQKKHEAPRNPWPFRIFLYAGTAVFTGLAIHYRAEKPYYIWSLLIVYNALAIVLYEAVWKIMNQRLVAWITGVMFAVGFVWDYFAFKYDWWIYNPIMGIKVLNIPIEDVNFYLYAPAAGLFLYLLAVRHFQNQKGR